MGNEITPQFNAALAEKVIKAYVDDDALTLSECINLEIPEESCELLQDVLECGPEGIITTEEHQKLVDARMAKEFVDGLAGTDGKKALRERVKWLADHLEPRRMDELAEIGPDAEYAVGPLIDTMVSDDRGLRYAARRALYAIGPVPSLIEILRDDNPHRRKQATEVLTNLLSRAVPALLKALRGKHPKLRERAAHILKNNSFYAKKYMPDLIKELSNKDPKVREIMALTLGRIGPEAKPAVPALTKALEDNRPRVREATAWALGRIGHAEAPVIDALEKLAKGDPDEGVRYMAKKALEKLKKY